MDRLSRQARQKPRSRSNRDNDSNSNSNSEHVALTRARFGSVPVGRDSQASAGHR